MPQMLGQPVVAIISSIFLLLPLMVDSWRYAEKMPKEEEIDVGMARAGLSECWKMIKQDIFKSSFTKALEARDERDMRSRAVELMSKENGPCDKLKPIIAKYMRAEGGEPVVMAPPNTFL